LLTPINRLGLMAEDFEKKLSMKVAMVG